MVGATLPGSDRDVWTGEVGSLQWASRQALGAHQRALGALSLNPAVGLETGAGFAAACNQGERLKPVRGAPADRAGGPLGSVSALRSGCDTTVAPGPTAPQFLATAPGSRQSVGRRGVPCVGRRACC